MPFFLMPELQQARESEARVTAAAKAMATLVAGAIAMLLSMPLGAEMGPADHFLMHVLPCLYSDSRTTLSAGRC